MTREEPKPDPLYVQFPPSKVTADLTVRHHPVDHMWQYHYRLRNETGQEVILSAKEAVEAIRATQFQYGNSWQGALQVAVDIVIVAWKKGEAKGERVEVRRMDG